MLLRHGIVYYDGKPWTAKHDAWLRGQRFTNSLTQSTFECYYDTALATTARRDRLDAQIVEVAANSEYTAVVRRLGCLRAIATLTGFGLAVEIGDWHRFTGNTIGSFVGLVPSEKSSGNTRVQGVITKTGNGHARRLLVEAAWHHRSRVPGREDRREDHARPMGPGVPSSSRPRRGRQPSPARPLGQVHRPQQEEQRREHRHRPRVGRLVLVPGRARGVAGHHRLR